MPQEDHPRAAALAGAARWFDAGALLETLRRRVAVRTESQLRERAPELERYLSDEIGPSVASLGFEWVVWPNPVAGAPPMLFAQRCEDAALPTVLTYGHGDVVAGYDKQWSEGRSPWEVGVAGRRWYGRGTADNKGQHTINLAALQCLLAARGRLGFNAKLLIEMGEEVGSPGLREVCGLRTRELAADVLIASDGPRLRSDRATIFLACAALNFDLPYAARGRASFRQLGRLLANPGTILANAIASLVDARGRILVSGLRPEPIPASVRGARDHRAGRAGRPGNRRRLGEPGSRRPKGCSAGTRSRCSRFAPAIRTDR
jgi:acetylornithine deacetylase/succinyl-diaminopimelate desuccinylase-like protein